MQMKAIAISNCNSSTRGNISIRKRSYVHTSPSPVFSTSKSPDYETLRSSRNCESSICKSPCTLTRQDVQVDISPFIVPVLREHPWGFKPDSSLLSPLRIPAITRCTPKASAKFRKSSSEFPLAHGTRKG